MATITGIEQVRGLVRVEADGRALCKVTKKSFAKVPLQVGDEFDEQQYLDRLCQAQAALCYEEALSLLDFSARASGELRRKLLFKGYLEPAVDATMQRLTETRLIDDQDYADRVVEGSRHKAVGLYQIKRKLKAKGVSDEAVETALGAVDEAQQREAALALAQKLAPKYEGQDPRAARAKLSQALARRGFSWDVISSALERLSAGDDWE